MRWLSIFRDPRIWAVILLAAMFRVGWSVYWTWAIGSELVAYEEEMSRLSPEERLEAEMRTADALAQNLLGVELGAELALAEIEAEAEADPAFREALDELRARPQPRPRTKISDIPVIRYDEPRGWEPPPWLLAGAIGGLLLVAGAAGSLYVWRATEDGEDAEDEAPPVA